jgi:hypothetical protein
MPKVAMVLEWDQLSLERLVFPLGLQPLSLGWKDRLYRLPDHHHSRRRLPL